MTLILAFIWGNGVVVVGDTRASMGDLFTEERKIYPISIDDLNLAAVAGSGDASLVHQGFELIERTFLEFLSEIGEVRNPTEEEVGQIVRLIEEKFMLRYSRLRNFGIKPEAELVLAAVSQEGTPLLYHFDSVGLADLVHLGSKYVILGHGRVTGAQLLLELLGYKPEIAEYYDMSVFPAFIIDLVSRVDPTVSPFLDPESSIYIRYSEEEKKILMGPLKIEEFGKIKGTIRDRLEIIRRAWQLAENRGDKYVLELLEGELEERDEQPEE